ncbi:MAG: flavodoxin family protein, partial [Planctomycetota bacterium]
MKVAIVNGSPRPKGVTARIAEILENAAVSAGAEAEVIAATRLKIPACIHCDGCIATGVCVFKDAAAEFFQNLIDSDMIVVAAPVYFAGVPAAFKAVIDRAQALWNRRYILKDRFQPKAKRALMLSTCGSKRKDMFDGIALMLYYFFDSLGVKFDREKDSLVFWKKEHAEDMTGEDAAEIEKFAI